MTDPTKGHPGRPKQSSGGIKSAWELALEKTEGLGKMSREELERQRQEERATVGRSLAQRYLSGLLLRDLLLALNRYQSGEKEGVKASILSALLEAVDLADLERAKNAVEGIAGLAVAEETQRLAREMNALLKEYTEALTRKWDESRSHVEQEQRKTLEREGISGSAVEPNIERKEALETVASSIRPEYDTRLVALKDKLRTR